MLLRGEGLHAISNDCNLVPLRLQVTLEAESYAGFVFNDQDLGHSTPLSLINPMTALEGVPIMAVGDRRREQDARATAWLLSARLTAARW